MREGKGSRGAPEATVEVRNKFVEVLLLASLMILLLTTLHFQSQRSESSDIQAQNTLFHKIYRNFRLFVRSIVMLKRKIMPIENFRPDRTRNEQDETQFFNEPTPMPEYTIMEETQPSTIEVDDMDYQTTMAITSDESLCQSQEAASETQSATISASELNNPSSEIETTEITQSPTLEERQQQTYEESVVQSSSFISTPTPNHTESPTSTPLPTVKHVLPIPELILNRIHEVEARYSAESESYSQNIHTVSAALSSYDAKRKRKEIKYYLRSTSADGSVQSHPTDSHLFSKFFRYFENVSLPKGDSGMWEADGEKVEFNFYLLSTASVDEIRFSEVPSNNCTISRFYVTTKGLNGTLSSELLHLRLNDWEYQPFSLPRNNDAYSVSIVPTKNREKSRHFCLPEFSLFENC